jgi:hypothetical protein
MDFIFAFAFCFIFGFIDDDDAVVVDDGDDDNDGDTGACAGTGAVLAICAVEVVGSATSGGGVLLVDPGFIGAIGGLRSEPSNNPEVRSDRARRALVATRALVRGLLPEYWYTLELAAVACVATRGLRAFGPFEDPSFGLGIAEGDGDLLSLLLSFSFLLTMPMLGWTASVCPVLIGVGRGMRASAELVAGWGAVDG